MFDKITKNTMSDCGRLVNRDYKYRSGDIQVVCTCDTGLDVDKTKEEAIENSDFIAYCFNLQQKYDIGLFEETISSLQEVLDYWDSGNFTRKQDMWDRMRSILIKVKQTKK